MQAEELLRERVYPQPAIAGAQLFGNSPLPLAKDEANPKAATFPSFQRPHDHGGMLRAGPLAEQEYNAILCKNLSVTVLILLLLSFFQFSSPAKLSNFYARKFTHITMGTCLLTSQPIGHLYMKVIILAVGVGAIMSCFVVPLRFSEKADKGIILYNLIVCIWVFFDLPLAALGPMFYADPCGAVAGRLFKSPAWFRNKTIAGSIAVFVVTFLTLFSSTSLLHRLGLAAVCCLLEAVGGRYDNMFVAFPLILYYFITQNQSISFPKYLP